MTDLRTEIENLLKIVHTRESRLELLVDGSKLEEMITDKAINQEVQLILSYASAVVIYRASPK